MAADVSSQRDLSSWYRWTTSFRVWNLFFCLYRKSGNDEGRQADEILFIIILVHQRTSRGAEDGDLYPR